jgi:hypothetical protein
MIAQANFTPVELAPSRSKLDGLDPRARQCRGRALSVGRPHAARDLADLVERSAAPRRRSGRPDDPHPPSPDSGPMPDAGRPRMKAMGTDIGTIHFVGIGGIGMSGIAEVMHQLGYKVQGSDVAEGYVVEGLRKAGIPVAIGHSADNLGDAAVVVCSTAIRDGNPESRRRRAAPAAWCAAPRCSPS